MATKRKKAFIDGDMFLFRLAWQVDKLGLSYLPSILTNMMRTWCPTGFSPYICLSDARWRNFRRLWWTDYKLNRDGVGGGPKCLKDLRTTTYSGTLRNFPKSRVIYKVGAEADDLMSVYALENPGSVIVSCDKDMLQVPGLHYHPLKGGFTLITPQQGEAKLLYQWAKGDMGDHIPGIYKHGDKAAEALLKHPKPHEAILLRYRLTHEDNPYPAKHGMHWLQYAMAMYRCVRLCRTRQELDLCTLQCPSIPRPVRLSAVLSVPGATSEPTTSPSPSDVTSEKSEESQS